jgi:putative heme-binding domain-containing protein
LIEMRSATGKYIQAHFYLLARKYDGQDIFYRAALNIALGTDPARRDAILADFDKQFPEWNDKVADLVWELRPKSVLPRLEKLLVDAKLTPAQKARIVDILAANEDPSAAKTVLGLLTQDVPAEVRSRVLENLRLFLPTKWASLAKSPEFTAVLASMLEKPESRSTGLELVQAATHYPSFGTVTRLATTAGEPTRKAAVATLGKLTGPHAVEALIPLVNDATIREQAIPALAAQIVGRGDSDSAKKALAALETLLPHADASVARQAALALAGTRAGTVRLLALKEANQFPTPLVAEVGTALRNSPFQGERNKALLLFPLAGKLDPKKLPSPAELAKRTGNPENGRKILAATLKNEVQCLKCHMVQGAGGQIGPDLSLIGKKGSKENLFESILNPSKAIADQYVSWKIDTADGAAITGLIVTESESTVTIRDANGKDYPIAKGDIEKRSKSLVSLMPDNLVAGLTEQELVDLVAHLATLQSAAWTPGEFAVAGPFPAGNMETALATEFPPEKEPFHPQSKGWKLAPTKADGYLDLAGIFGKRAESSASYLAVRFDSPTAQPATVVLGTDDKARLWLNGKPVWTGGGTRAAAPDQDRVEVTLQPGVNTLLLKVANGNNPHGAYLTVLSSQEVKAEK